MTDGSFVERKTGEPINRREFLKLVPVFALATGAVACRLPGALSGKEDEEGVDGEFQPILGGETIKLKHEGVYKTIGIRYANQIEPLQIRKSGLAGKDEDGAAIYRPEGFVPGQTIARIVPEVLDLGLQKLKVHPDALDKQAGIWKTAQIVEGMAERVRVVEKNESVVGLSVAVVVKEDMWEGEADFETNKLKLGPSQKIGKGFAIGSMYTNEFLIEGYCLDAEAFVPDLD